MADGFDVVAVRVVHERGVEVLVVVRAEARCAVVEAAGRERGAVEGVDGRAVSPKCDVGDGAGRPGPKPEVRDRVVAGAERGVSVSLEGEPVSERLESGGVEALARVEIADDDGDVVEHGPGASSAIAGAGDAVVREAELSAVAEELGRRGPRALLFTGDPGVGKTTVLAAAAESARLAGRSVLACGGSSAETRLSFAAIGDLLEPVADGLLPRLPPPQRRALAAALLLDADEEAASVDVRAVGLALLSVLRASAREAPCFVGIDDLQWLDDASAVALEFALRRLRSEPVLVVATAREGDLPLDLFRALPTRRLSVGPLSLGELHRVLAIHLGEPPARRPLRRLHELSGGNPFYALELVRAFGANSDFDDGRLPESLDALVRGRLDALPAATRRVLFDVAALADPTADLVDVDALEPAVDSRVVLVERERIRFAHPLLAAAAYGRLPHARRRDAHARLAELVPTREERARHLALATDAPDEAVASELAATAAERLAHGAAAAAAELLEHAVRLTPRGPARCERMLVAADAHLAAGQWVRARTLLEELQGAGGSFDAEAAVRLAGWVLVDVEAGVALCEAALDEARADPGLRARLRGALCANLHLLGDYARAVAEARRAVDDAERSGDPRATAVALGYLGMFEVIRAEGDPVAHLMRARELAGGEEQLLPVRPRTWLGLRHLYRYELDEARTLLEAARDDAVETADDAQLSGVLLHLCELEWRCGNWQAALAHALEGESLAEQIGDVQGRGALLYAVALVTGQLGRVEESRAATTEGLRLCAGIDDRLFPALHALAAGLLEFSLGEHALALERFAVLDTLFVAQALEPEIAPYQGSAIEALVSLGRLDEARRRSERLEPRAAELGRAAVLADVLRGRAAREAAAGDLDGALAGLDRSLALLEPLQAPFARARTQLARAVVLRRARKRGAARVALEQAEALFSQLGAAIWVSRAQSELARISGRRRGDGTLTETERRIAELVADGRSNKEVAAALFVTVRTVESNLTRIYGKLGIRSRTELARRMLD